MFIRTRENYREVFKSIVGFKPDLRIFVLTLFNTGGRDLPGARVLIMKQGLGRDICVKQTLPKTLRQDNHRVRHVQRMLFEAGAVPGFLKFVGESGPSVEQISTRVTT